MARDHVDGIQDQWRAERPDLDPSPQGIIGRIHRLGGHLHEELVAVYREHGLGEGDFDVLASLRRTGEPFELPAGQLAEHTMVTTGGMTKRLDRLEQAGLLERRIDADDARVRRVRLTERGREVIDAAFGDHMRNEARLLAELPTSDRLALERILRDWLVRIEGAVD
ncbi:MAG: MarR family transcriptional regulator [Microbacteriaceae bacterium]|nr:MAG: MarR family transcriptional regulator [Microbacteriaceae bacterium]